MQNHRWVLSFKLPCSLKPSPRQTKRELMATRAHEVPGGYKAPLHPIQMRLYRGTVIKEATHPVEAVT